MKKICILTFLLCLSFALQHSVFGQKIITAPGPEDVLIDYSQGDPRILVSCAERRMMKEDGWVYAIDPKTNLASELELDLKILPEGHYFYPHGFDIGKIGDEYFVYVIVHMKEVEKIGEQAEITRQSIIKFKVQKDKLIAVRIFENKLMVAPNDILVLPDGGFIIGNCMGGSSKRDTRRALIFGKSDGSLVHFNAVNNTYQIIDEDLKYPNGMVMDDRYFYLSCTKSDEILRYDYQLLGGEIKLMNKQSIVKIKAPDNLFMDKGKIILSSIPKPLNFMKHAKSASNFCPGKVLSYNIEKDVLTELFSTDGSNISTISGALFLDNSLYVSQVFQPWVYLVNMK